jgi:hypothetical protein
MIVSLIFWLCQRAGRLARLQAAGPQVLPRWSNLANLEGAVCGLPLNHDVVTEYNSVGVIQRSCIPARGGVWGEECRQKKKKKEEVSPVGLFPSKIPGEQ